MPDFALELLQRHKPGVLVGTARLLRSVAQHLSEGASGVCRFDEHEVLSLASQDVVEIERSAGYAERIITRSIDRAGRGGDGHCGVSGRVELVI